MWNWKRRSMPDLEEKDQSDFLIERIKVKPVNRKKLIRRTFITAAMAVIFGLIACFTFLVLEPVLSNWLYPEEEPPLVMFPADQEEMLPEEMLAENIPTESPEPTQVPEPTQIPEEEGPVLDEKQIQEILSGVTLDLENYGELHTALYRYVNKLDQYMVTVTAVTSNVDWFRDVQESRNQCSGVAIYNTGRELLILTGYSSIRSAERLLVTMYDNTMVEAELKQRDLDTDLAVLAVKLDDLPLEITEQDYPIAQFGSSNVRNLAGLPVVAVGSPMGISNSVGYGIITSSGSTVSMTDRNYKLLLTDINGSRSASGVLFDLEGQVMGIITNKQTDADRGNLITAYGISDLQKILEKMSNASAVAYMGIRGVDVPREANREYGTPYGAYVEEVDMDSPAMRAGIQRGDVIVGMNDTEVINFRNYSNALMEMEPGQTVEVLVKRQVQDEYREMSFSIELREGK